MSTCDWQVPIGKKVPIQGGVACATSARIPLIVQYDGSGPSVCRWFDPTAWMSTDYTRGDTCKECRMRCVTSYL